MGMQLKNKRLIFFIIFAVFGMAVSAQFRTILNSNRQKALTALSVDNLKKQIEEQRTKVDDLTNLINKEEKQKEEYLKASAEKKNDEYMKILLDSIALTKLKAGLTDVKGSGVEIKLDDASVRENEDPRDLIIHDTYIIRILNDLKKAGAQAISINGERIVATSEQVCAGPTIRINKNRYAVPYTIKVIGDPDALSDSLDRSETVALMKENKIKIDISKSKEILIPKYITNLEKISSSLEVVN